MLHFPFNPSPLIKSDYFSQLLNCNFYIKREDLLTPAGGGSKARMLQYILKKAVDLDSDYILTAGGPYSNFNRALALMCGSLGIKMRLIIYNNNEHLRFNSLNKRICDLCQVEYIPCESHQVSEILGREERKLINEGHRPYFIWGGGKSIEGVQAYYDCIEEIICHNHILPNFIFTPVGTGTTLSGLTLGLEESVSDGKVIGISVARNFENANKEVNAILKEFAPKINKKKHLIVDDYLFGGYGHSNYKLEEFIQSTIINQGIILDQIYVGKALYGTYDFIKKSREEFDGRNVIFMNTGGLYNF